MKPCIFLAGASGVGKSTLMEAVAADLDLPTFPSVNGQVYADLGTTFDAAARDPALLYRCQAEIHRRVLARLAEPHPDGLVADRSVDLVVYTVEMLGGWDCYKDWGLSALEAAVQSPQALLFFVRPHPAVLAAARAADDGRRARFLDEAVVRRMDGQMEFYFEDRGFRYVTLDSPRMKDRMRTVRWAVDLWRAARATPAAGRCASCDGRCPACDQAGWGA